MIFYIENHLSWGKTAEVFTMKMPVSFKVKNRTVNFDYIPVRCSLHQQLLSVLTKETKKDLDLRRRRVFDELDATHFQSLVVFVAGIGFFTDGYDVSYHAFSSLQYKC